METKTVKQTENKALSRRMEGLVTLFDLHTPLLSRALEGISAEDCHNRLGTKANHMAWLAGALVLQRFEMAKETSPGLHQTGEELFSDYKGIQDNAKYPSSEEYVKDWDMVSPHAREALVIIDDEKLDSEIDMGGMKMTYYDMISFTIYREASMIGQLALWRRLLGYPALRYD
ncbi:DinB family protein [Flavitalea antarctica]